MEEGEEEEVPATDSEPEEEQTDKSSDEDDADYNDVEGELYSGADNGDDEEDVEDAADEPALLDQLVASVNILNAQVAKLLKDKKESKTTITID